MIYQEKMCCPVKGEEEVGWEGGTRLDETLFQ